MSFWTGLLIPIAWCCPAGEETGVRLYFFSGGVKLQERKRSSALFFSYNHWSRRGPTGGFLIHLFIYYFLAKNQYHVGVLLRSLHCPSFGSTASGDRRAHGCTHSGSTQYTIYISYPGRLKVQMADGVFQGGYYCFG